MGKKHHNSKPRYNIHQFITTGKVSGYGLGCPLSSFKNKFKNQAIESFNLDDSIGYFFGPYEFIFLNQIAVSISVDKNSLKNCYIAKSQKEKIKIDRIINMNSIIKYLNNSKIKWEFDSQLTKDKSIYIKLLSGIYILIDCSDNIPEIDKFIL